MNKAQQDANHRLSTIDQPKTKPFDYQIKSTCDSCKSGVLVRTAECPSDEEVAGSAVVTQACGGARGIKLHHFALAGLEVALPDVSIWSMNGSAVMKRLRFFSSLHTYVMAQEIFGKRLARPSPI